MRLWRFPAWGGGGGGSTVGYSAQWGLRLQRSLHSFIHLYLEFCAQYTVYIQSPWRNGNPHWKLHGKQKLESGLPIEEGGMLPRFHFPVALQSSRKNWVDPKSDLTTPCETKRHNSVPDLRGVPLCVPHVVICGKPSLVSNFRVNGPHQAAKAHTTPPALAA